MRNTRTLEIVKGVLETHPYTRSDDFALIIETAKRFGLNTYGYSFESTMSEWRRRHYPPFETITRARRKLQKEYPYLRANDVVRQRRAQSAERDREFFGQQQMFRAMKTNELMIDDWVFLEGKPTQVKATDFDTTAAGYFEPIPLTEEILEKIGIPYNEKFCCWLLSGVYVIALQRRKTDWWLCVTHSKEAGEISIPINYVHELQHALRLFGVDKTIEL